MKIRERNNFRVVIEPRYLGDYGSFRTNASMFYPTQEAQEAEYLKRCKAIEEQVNRHVDDIGSVNIEWDNDYKCSHCGHGWEVSEDDTDPEFPKGTPMCCQKAIDEYNEEKNKTASV